MSLDEVHLVSDVLHSCTVHALTTASEEIMGILLGDVIKAENGKSVCRIWRAIPQIRTDRRKDRVEPSHQQLSDCIDKADRLTKTTDSLTRVVGWYHSHPNITVLPSHVDLRTQAHHQTLDSGFVGLIISCFNKDQVLKCTAFQAVSAGGMDGAAMAGDLHPLNGGSVSEADQINQAIQLSLREARTSSAVSDSTQLEHSRIPLQVVRPFLPCEYSQMDCATLHKTLLNEETHAYNRTLTNQKNVSSLVHQYQSTVFYQSLLQLVNGVFVPNLNALMTLSKQNEVNCRQLREQIDEEQRRLNRATEETGLDQLIFDCPSLPTTELDRACKFDTGQSRLLDTHASTVYPPQGQTSEMMPPPGAMITERVPFKVNGTRITSEAQDMTGPLHARPRRQPNGSIDSTQGDRRPQHTLVVEELKQLSLNERDNPPEPRERRVPGPGQSNLDKPERTQTLPRNHGPSNLHFTEPDKSIGSTTSFSRLTGTQFVPFLTEDPPRPPDASSRLVNQPIPSSDTPFMSQRQPLRPQADIQPTRMPSNGVQQTSGPRRESRLGLPRRGSKDSAGSSTGATSRDQQGGRTQQQQQQQPPPDNVPRIMPTDDYARQEKRPAYRYNR